MPQLILSAGLGRACDAQWLPASLARSQLPDERGVSGGAVGTNGKRALALVAVVLVVDTLRTYCLDPSLRTWQSQGVCVPWVKAPCKNKRRRWLASTCCLICAGL